MTSNYISSCLDATDCKIGEYNSLALDPATHRPVIALSYHDKSFSDFLDFRVYDGSTWSHEVVALGTPAYISLAYDTAGTTRKARLVWKRDGLKYSYRNAVDDWSTVEIVDASSSAAEWVSLSVIGTTPHVVHFNTANGNLNFVDHDRTSWLAPYTAAIRGHHVGDCSSLAVDKLGRLHTSYFDSTNSTLKYLRYEIGVGASMSNIIDSSGSASCFSVLAVDPANNPAVGFLHGSNLYISWLSGSSWLSPLLVDTGVTSSFAQGFGMALEPDGSGYPHFAYRKGNDLWYTYWTGSGWSKTLVVAGSATGGGGVALALSPAKTPFIAYYEGAVLYHLTKNALGWWIIEQIAGSGAGVGAAIVVDQNGNAMAAYLDSIGMNLTFSSRSSVRNIDPPYTCLWTPGVVVDPQGEEFFSLAVDRSGTPHLATWVFSNGNNLHYITVKGMPGSCRRWTPIVIPAGNQRLRFRPAAGLASAIMTC